MFSLSTADCVQFCEARQEDKTRPWPKVATTTCTIETTLILIPTVSGQIMWPITMQRLFILLAVILQLSRHKGRVLGPQPLPPLPPAAAGGC